MSVLRGHEDLKDKAVVGFDMGFALVQTDQGVKRYRLTIGAGGRFSGEPVPEEPITAVDQVNGGSIDAENRARRFRDIDQPI